MSRHGAIELSWGGGEHTFRLGLGEIEELEASTDMSVFVLFAAMNATVPEARLRHYSETIRLGLIGGGLAPMEARTLVRRYVDERPLYESVALGEAILRAGLERVHGTPAGDASAGEQPAPETSGSTSAPSMGTQPSSESATSGA